MPDILLIETSATLRHALRTLLVKEGYNVSEAEDFGSGLAALRDFDKDSALNGVVVGWPARTDPLADELFSLMEDSAYSHISLLTLAHDPEPAILNWAGNRPRTAFLLWDNYTETSDSLSMLLTQSVESPAYEFHSNDDTSESISILFVDDSPTVRVNFRKLLTKHGYKTDTAASVDEGFEKALESHFDIAIIDYFMPDATGDELCRCLRDNPDTTKIITAIITGTYLDKVIKDSLNAGAIECMFKNESNDLFLARIEAMSRAIHDRRSIENERRRLNGILGSVGEGVYGVDKKGRITFINPTGRNLLGYMRHNELNGMLAHEAFHYADPDGNSIESEESKLQHAYLNGEKLNRQEAVFWHSSQKPIPVELTVYPLNIEDKFEGSVVAFRDISERKLLEDELKWQATHDSLTRMHNRHYFETQLNNEVHMLKRTGKQSALLYIDLDRFKYINDTAGHTAGDQLLIEVGSKLSSRLRKSDLLARIGGDEFAIILRNIRANSISAVADLFREALNQFTFVYQNKQYRINASVGVAIMDKETSTAGEALANADIACHIAKSEGRNLTHIYQHENDQKRAMDIELGWSTRLHNALSNDHFALHFQPILTVRNIPDEILRDDPDNLFNHAFSRIGDSVLNFEVLIRLNENSHDIYYPGSFLPTAERFNMMQSIDQWVVTNAIERLAMLTDNGYLASFFINLSGQTLANTRFTTMIKEMIQDHKIRPELVNFEITETCAISNIDAATAFINDLNALGCHFALDDFGSGFCSFSHLKHLPVDLIKIDGLFTQGVNTDPIDNAIVNSINSIAHSLGKKTIAEYVETREIMDVVIKSGVDFIQGNYIAKPMDMKDFLPGKLVDSLVSPLQSKSGA